MAQPLFLYALILISLTACQNQQPESTTCQPTPFDEIGPFYRPNAPIRTKVGTGYSLSGQVRSATDCRPLPGAVLEFWLVNELGEYDDAHRATVIADRRGRYSFASNRPGDYVSRLPHIHLRVSAGGHESLTTQHYPGGGQSTAKFDLTLSEKKD